MQVSEYNQATLVQLVEKRPSRRSEPRGPEVPLGEVCNFDASPPRPERCQFTAAARTGSFHRDKSRWYG